MDDMKLSVELGLPGFKLGLNGINLTRGKRKAKDGIGPFLLISRASGLALDTGYGVDNGAPVTVWSPHGQQQQFWSLFSSGYAEEFVIRAEMGGLDLDATTDHAGANHPLLWRHHGGPWQRWRLLASPDGVGHFLQSVHSGRFLAMNADGVNGWAPWFEADPDSNSMNMQWLLVRAYSRN